MGGCFETDAKRDSMYRIRLDHTLANSPVVVMDHLLAMQLLSQENIKNDEDVDRVLEALALALNKEQPSTLAVLGDEGKVVTYPSLPSAEGGTYWFVRTAEGLLATRWQRQARADGAPSSKREKRK